MKKRVIFGVLFLFLLLNISFIIAAGNETDDMAYDCLEEKVKDNCPSLSSEEQIFSLLAIGECKDEIVADLDDYQSDIKLMAQAILALSRTGTDTSEYEEWLLSQNKTPDDMDWLLQVESSEATTCTIDYEGLSTPINVILNEDKTILVSGVSGCFVPIGYGEDDFWLKILSSCYDKEFEISCTSSFLTNLLYKKTSDPANEFYVSAETHLASAGGSTTEKVNSFCFKQGTSCNYEGSLWAAIVLSYRGFDVSSFLPYLITMADDNNELLPEAFLYLLTGDFRTELLNKQKSDKWWLESTDKYYDTALALFPFQNEELEHKTNTINWLSETQKEDGCWDTSLRNIAFLLYSIWPRGISEEDGKIDCESAGYYCISSMSCLDAEGDVLKSYSGCFGTNICCNKEKPLESCSEQGGEICDSDEECSTSTVDASDTSECCIGSCAIPVEKSECELYADGSCRTSCYGNEEEALEYDCSSGQICCIEKTASEKKSYWWIWVLLILIVLAVLGIIFRDKLRPIWFKIKSKLKKFKSKKSKPGPRPGFPSTPLGMRPRTTQRKILPPSARRPPVKRPAAGRPKKTDMDDVLKKLREMGK